MPPLNTTNAARLGLNGANLSLNPNAPALNKLGINTNSGAAPSTTGIKAVMPGGLATTQKNTIKKAQMAPLASQTAIGNSINSSTIGSGSTGNKGSMGTLMSQAYNPQGGGVTNVGGTDYQGGHAVTGYPTGGTPQAPQTVQPAPQAPATFGGMVGGLASTSMNGSQNATAATNGLLQAPVQNETLSNQAQAIGTRYGDQIARVSNYGNALAGSYTTGAGLAPVSQGLAGQAQNTTANEVQGLQSAENAALAPIDKELLAQSQAQAGLTSAGSVANTQQANVQSGLNAAGQLAEPSGAFPFAFNPLTGSFSNAAGGTSGAGAPTLTYNPQQDAQTLAGLVIGGKIPYQDAVSAMGYAKDVGTGLLQTAIAGQGGNIAQLQGQAAGTQASAASGGQAAAQLTGQLSGIQSSANGAEANFTLLSNIAHQGGVNDTNVPVLNRLQQNVQKGLASKDAVVNFQALIQSVRGQYATILGGGTSSVEALNEAQSLIPDNISLGALDSLGKNLKSDAQNRVAGIQQQIDALNHGSNGSTGNSGGGSTSGFGWNG